MQVLITSPQEDQVLVNGKLVYKDGNGKWVASEELTTIETREFRKHLEKGVQESETIKSP